MSIHTTPRPAEAGAVPLVSPLCSALVATILSGGLIAQEPPARPTPQEPEARAKEKEESRARSDSTLPTIPPPDPAAAEVPSGYRVEVALDGLMYPSSVEFGDDGTMYVAECGYMPGDTTRPARILAVPASSRDRGEPRRVVTDQLTGPVTDLLWHDGRLYVSHKAKISVVENGKVTDLVTGLPSLGDHSNNQLAIGPDGKLYFGQGSATNSGVVGPDNFAFGWPKKHPEVCETSAKDVTLAGQDFESKDPRDPAAGKTVRTSAYQPFGTVVPPGVTVKGVTKANGTVLRCDPDGKNLEIFAWGFRNPYGVAFAPDGRLLVADAGSDARGSRKIANAPEKLFAVKQDAWCGWPDFEGGIPITDPRFQVEGEPPLEFLLATHPPVEKPLMTFEVHSSITQIEFSRADAFGASGAMFLGASGDQSPVTAVNEVRAGYWVKRVDLATGRAETFFRTKPSALGPKDLEYVTTAGPKRIVDLRFSPQGDALYAVDIGPIHYVEGAKGPEPKSFPGTGVVWRIVRAE